jgi:hypothetical protein
MPQFLSFPVGTCEDYVSKIRPRLKHPGPDRLPGYRAGLTEGYKKRDYALGLHVIGLFGFLRNLPGLEEPSVGRNLMCLLFDGRVSYMR